MLSPCFLLAVCNGFNKIQSAVTLFSVAIFCHDHPGLPSSWNGLAKHFAETCTKSFCALMMADHPV